jgi:alanine racemase
VSSAAVARIRLRALQNNLDRVRQAAPGCRVMAVIKANAYGHGLEAVSGALEAADAFAVARIEEGIHLRKSNRNKPIVILNAWTDQQDLADAFEHDLQLVVHDQAQIEMLESIPVGGATDSGPLHIWLKVDSGMGRLGIAPDNVQRSIKRLQACNAVASDLRLMTHLACADEPDNPATHAQIDCFAETIGQWEGDVSIANSAAVLAWPETLGTGERLRYSGQNWVRPGLMLYGVTPFVNRPAAELGLEPVMSFEGRLISVRKLSRGSRVGYGGDWQATRDSVLGVINVGYGDGYPWRLKGGTPVSINGSLAPVVGRISMDLISLDLTDVPGVKIGDTAVLWGVEPDVVDLAQRAGTTPYELLTGVGSRVKRICD